MNEHKFDGKGEIYKKYRPDYSDEFIDWLYSEGGFSAESVVADIGSGTGIFTRPCLKKAVPSLLLNPMRICAKWLRAVLKNTAVSFLSAAAVRQWVLTVRALIL